MKKSSQIIAIVAIAIIAVVLLLTNTQKPLFSPAEISSTRSINFNSAAKQGTITLSIQAPAGATDLLIGEIIPQGFQASNFNYQPDINSENTLSWLFENPAESFDITYTITQISDNPELVFSGKIGAVVESAVLGDSEIILQQPCIADCSGKACGDDGCGGSCGTCQSGFNCSNGACISLCTPQQEICTDNIDNDCDNLIDINDTQDCIIQPPTPVIVYPSSDGSKLEWQTQSGSLHYAMINKIVKYPNLPSTSTWIMGTMPNQQDIVVSNASLAKVSQVKVYTYGDDMMGGASVSISNDGATWQTSQALNFGARTAWDIKTFNVNWAQTQQLYTKYTFTGGARIIIYESYSELS